MIAQKFINYMSGELERIMDLGDPRRLRIRENFKQGANLNVIWNSKSILILVNPYNLSVDLASLGNISEAQLKQISCYHGGSLYGKTKLCKSDTELDRYFNNNVIEISIDTKINFIQLFHIFVNYFSDYQVKKVNCVYPETFYKHHLGVIEDFYDNFLILSKNREELEVDLDSISMFYSRVINSTIPFHLFEKWDILLTKRPGGIFIKSLELAHNINRSFQSIIDATSEFEEYVVYLVHLLLLLNQINYYNLISREYLPDQYLHILENFSQLTI